ncbi:MAG: hypothetical protein LBT12_00175 [Oscillospiraceae bacterium]|jgi:hypothetical protein|nr:hypothetical protein [Oscillospiraceae bacterium]
MPTQQPQVITQLIELRDAQLTQTRDFSRAIEIIKIFNEILAEAKKKLGEEMPDAIERDWLHESRTPPGAMYSYQIVADEIDATCDVCKTADGLALPENLVKKGYTAPPFHPNCRCHALGIGIMLAQDLPGWEGETPQLVSREQLEAMEWVNVTDEMVRELNAALSKYGITDPNSIAYLIAQATRETGGNKSLLNTWEQHNWRGAGYIHLTGEAHYYAYATKLITDKYPTLGEYKNPSSNDKSHIIDNYDRVVQNADDVDIDISTFTKIITSDTPYLVIAENFAWDSVAYFWTTQTYGNKHGMTPNQIAEVGGTVDEITNVINMDDPPDGRKERRENYENAYQIFILGEY